MTTDTKIVLRLRAVFVSGISVALSIAAHALGGGAVPEQDTVVLLLGVALASGALAAQRRLPIALPLVCGQLAGHVVLGLQDGHLHAPTLAMVSAHALAVAVAAVLVRGAEWGGGIALAALHRLLPDLHRPAPVAVPGSTGTVYRPRVGRGVLLVGGVGSRGPPVVLR